MTATRTYVAPTKTRSAPRAPDGVIHLIGDTHFGSPPMTAVRKNVWAADLEHIAGTPTTVTHVVMGDVTDHALPAEDAEAVEYLNRHLGAGRWYAAVGNHDLYGARTVPNDAAVAWGMPAANYVVDFPAFRLVVTCPEGLTVPNDAIMTPFTSDRLNWIAAQCAASGGKPALIVCHWSLYNTTGVGEDTATQYLSSDFGFYATVDADIRTMLADVPTARAWISGHTHSPLEANGLCTQLTIGGRSFAAINASSPAYTGKPSNNLTSPINSLYAAVDASGITVYFRNHGAGQWIPPGAGRDRSWRVSF